MPHAQKSEVMLEPARKVLLNDDSEKRVGTCAIEDLINNGYNEKDCHLGESSVLTPVVKGKRSLLSNHNQRFSKEIMSQNRQSSDGTSFIKGSI